MEQALDGEVTLCLSRAPDFFKALEVEGITTDVLVVEDLYSSKIVGSAARSEREVWVDGRLQRLGYLSSLRIDPAYRKGSVLWRGFEFLSQLHEHGEVPAYLISVLKSNKDALNILTSGRGPLPKSRSLGTYQTLILRPNSSDLSGDRCPVKTLNPSDASKILEFTLNFGARQRQFYPSLSRDFSSETSGPFLGLTADAVLVYEEDGQIVGTVAIWNQRKYRQWKVPEQMLNIVTPYRKHMPRVFFLALVCIANDNLRVFHSLLQRALLSFGESDTLIVGFHEDDPLLPLAREYASLTIESTLELLYWPDGEGWVDELGSAIPYIEVGCL